MRKSGIIVAVIAIGLLAILLWQRQNANDLKAQTATLRTQKEQAQLLEAENEKLSAQMQATKDRAQSERNDLSELRTRAPEMNKIEEDNARLKSQVRAIRKVAEAKAAAEFDGHAGLHWGNMVLSYAREHQGQFPATLQDTLPLLTNEFPSALAAKIAATVDYYELTYHGNLRDLTNPPPEAAIIVRSKEPWRGFNGVWTKDYGNGGGAGLLHPEPDGNFEKFESSRIPK